MGYERNIAGRTGAGQTVQGVPPDHRLVAEPKFSLRCLGLSLFGLPGLRSRGLVETQLWASLTLPLLPGLGGMGIPPPCVKSRFFSKNFWLPI
jgi:hypothetical protein